MSRGLYDRVTPAAWGGYICLGGDTELQLAATARDLSGSTLTSTQPVGAPEDPALLDLAERGEHHPDVVLVAFLRNHSYEQFSVFHS